MLNAGKDKRPDETGFAKAKASEPPFNVLECYEQIKSHPNYAVLDALLREDLCQYISSKKSGVGITMPQYAKEMNKLVKDTWKDLYGQP